MNRVSRIALGGAAAVVIACGAGELVGPDAWPLAGLSKTTANDTSSGAHTPTGTGPGYFQGTVMGPSAPGGGNDTLSTAPRIAGVVVTIYERKADEADSVSVGEAKGSVTTGADGRFTLPVLPAGNYVVTLVPPANSGYYGAYAFGPLRENSSEYPWWVVLARK